MLSFCNCQLILKEGTQEIKRCGLKVVGNMCLYTIYFNDWHWFQNQCTLVYPLKVEADIFVHAVTVAWHYHRTCLHYNVLNIDTWTTKQFEGTISTLWSFHPCGHIYHKRCWFSLIQAKLFEAIWERFCFDFDKSISFHALEIEVFICWKEVNPPPCMRVVLLDGRLMYRHIACTYFFDIQLMKQFVIGYVWTPSKI